MLAVDHAMIFLCCANKYISFILSYSHTHMLAHYARTHAHVWHIIIGNVYSVYMHPLTCINIYVMYTYKRICVRGSRKSVHLYIRCIFKRRERFRYKQQILYRGRDECEDIVSVLGNTMAKYCIWISVSCSNSTACAQNHAAGAYCITTWIPIINIYKHTRVRQTHTQRAREREKDSDMYMFMHIQK